MGRERGGPELLQGWKERDLVGGRGSGLPAGGEDRRCRKGEGASHGLSFQGEGDLRLLTGLGLEADLEIWSCPRG